MIYSTTLRLYLCKGIFCKEGKHEDAEEQETCASCCGRTFSLCAIGKAEQWQNKEKNNDGQTDVSWISKMPIVPNTCVDLQELFVIVLGIVGNFRPFVEYLMLIIDEGGKLTDTAYNNFFEKHKKVQEDIMERDNNKEDLDIKEIMKIIHSYIL